MIKSLCNLCTKFEGHAEEKWIVLKNFLNITLIECYLHLVTTYISSLHRRNILCRMKVNIYEQFPRKHNVYFISGILMLHTLKHQAFEIVWTCSNCYVDKIYQLHANKNLLKHNFISQTTCSETQECSLPRTIKQFFMLLMCIKCLIRKFSRKHLTDSIKMNVIK